MHHHIDISGDLRKALEQYTEVPDINTEEGRNKPFVKDYEIEIMDNGCAHFWFNITTHNLMKHIKTNPEKLFQTDPTYKVS